MPEQSPAMTSGGDHLPAPPTTSPRSTSDLGDSRPVGQKPGTQPASQKSKLGRFSRLSLGADASETGMSGRSSVTSRRVKENTAELEALGLTALNMCGQGITGIAATTFARSDVGALDLSANNIRAVPSDLRRLTPLRRLDLSGNALRCAHPHDQSGLPAALSSLPHLSVLLLAECGLAFVPPAVWRCRRLRVLDLSRNRLGLLGAEVANLAALRHLNVQQTHIASLPAEIAICQELRELLLWGNAMESLPDTLKELPKLKLLAVNYRSFCGIVNAHMDKLLRKGQYESDHVPPVIFELPAIDMLDLEHTKINRLPRSCAANLSELRLGHNYLQAVPPVVPTLTSLRLLQLSHNLLSHLPDDLSALASLQTLDLSDNAIVDFPPSLTRLPRLVELSLAGNVLKSLPHEIGDLTSLKTLLVDRNELRSLPTSIVDLASLETLDVSNNLLTELPPGMEGLRMIATAHTYRGYRRRGLWLCGNPLSCPPPAVWNTTDVSRIYSHMRREEICARTPHRERQRMALLGAVGAGKTALLRALVAASGDAQAAAAAAAAAPHDSPTQLAELRAWRSQNGVQFLTYDFSGDDVYRPTLPLFVDRNVMVVLVYDSSAYSERQHEEAIACWLELLILHAPGAVVKVVGTHADVGSSDLESQAHEIQRRISNQLEQHDASVKNLIAAIDAKIHGGSLPEYTMDQLQRQRARLRSLDTMQVLPEVSFVGCPDDIPRLADDLERLAVDDALFPRHRRKNNTWSRLGVALRLRPGHHATWRDVALAAQPLGIVGEALTDAVHFLRDTGHVAWAEAAPKIIFHNPARLVAALRAVFAPARDERFFDPTLNHVLAARGRFESGAALDEAVRRYRTEGGVSRALLRCFWFQLKLDETAFEKLAHTVARLDLWYVVPQQVAPPHQTVFQPMLVVPGLNLSVHTDEEIAALWPRALTPDLRQLTLRLTFPLARPTGVFERFACRLQRHLVSRTDWRDAVHAVLPQATLLATREAASAAAPCAIVVRLRGVELRRLRELWCMLGSEMRAALEGAGLVWLTSHEALGCSPLPLHDCFPHDVLTL